MKTECQSAQATEGRMYLHRVETVCVCSCGADESIACMLTEAREEGGLLYISYSN